MIRTDSTSQSRYAVRKVQANYSDRRAGEIGLPEALAQEGARAVITVKRYRAGLHQHEAVQAIAKEMLEKNILPHSSIGRLGDPEEMARCVVLPA
jgi:NAD(P)-dependent dehydrogenase (short-subunit alcohol dehydrogenase family)